MPNPTNPTNPFPKGPPCYSMVCPTVMHVESIVQAIGRRIQRCIDHQVPLGYKVVCGTDDAGNLLRLMLKGKGLDPKGTARKDFAGKRRRDLGDGPVIHGTIPGGYLPVALQSMGPRAKPGAVVAYAQPTEATSGVAEAVTASVADDLG